MLEFPKLADITLKERLQVTGFKGLWTYKSIIDYITVS
jgi:hypothetical protein